MGEDAWLGNSSHITPHCWSAAEMLLLQLDMLAYVKEDSRDRPVVIGAGGPRTLLDRPMSVKGLRLTTGCVDWEWNGHRMKVVLHGTTAPVILGTGSPAGAPIYVNYLGS
jgi:hypothetical protein